MSQHSILTCRCPGCVTDLRTDRENASRVVAEQAAEIERLKGELEREKATDCRHGTDCIRILDSNMAAERDSLKAEAEGRLGQLRLSAKLLSEMTGERDALKAELERARCMVPQDVTDELHSLRAQLAEAQTKIDGLRSSEAWRETANARNQRDAAEAQLKATREALEKYGDHSRICKRQSAYNIACVCGFSAALSASTPKAEPDECAHGVPMDEPCGGCGGEPRGDERCEQKQSASAPKAEPSRDVLMRVAEKVREADDRWMAQRFRDRGQETPRPSLSAIVSEVLS